MERDQNGGWLDHPIVRHARMSLPSDATPLDLLEKTMGLMLELEDRFPSLPFAQILSYAEPDPDADLGAMRATLVSAGVSRADIATLIPLDPSRPRRHKFSADQLMRLRREFGCRTGTIRQFAKANGMSKATIYRLIKNGWSYACVSGAGVAACGAAIASGGLPTP